MIEQEKIVIGGIYQHYKGMKYKLLNIIRHSETLEELALYETLYENKLGKFWVRPKEMFFEHMPNGIPRFKFLNLAETEIKV